MYLISLMLIILGIFLIYKKKAIKFKTKFLMYIFISIGALILIAGIIIASHEFISGFKEGWKLYSKF